MEFEIYAATHSGLIRSNNEDYFYIPASQNESGILVAVADGMGGHKAGEIASKLAVDTFVEDFNSNHSDDVPVPAKLFSALDKANSKVYNSAKDKLRLNNMGTTLTACYAEGNKVTFVNVGDSRAYLVHKGTAEQVTKDHSIVQELLMKDIITEEEAENHPQKNMITRAVGIESKVHGDLFTKNTERGDCIVLCTDGLSKLVSVENVSLLFDLSCTAESITKTLIDLALAKGGTDNVTVITVRCK